MALLFPLSLCKERGYAGQAHFCGACWSLSAHIKRCPNEKGYPMRGHILLSPAAKVGKNAAGVPPDPRWSAGFLLGKPALPFFPEPMFIQQGRPRPPGTGWARD